MTIAGLALGLGAAVMVVDQALLRTLPLLGRFLPDDVCGPDGWLIDTVNNTGIFDLQSRRRG
ncbi:hypothetical protein [Marinovum sp.]|uniref:hypothetical protein n=1 Tax=Marinovum sp. TaxID=2024839 RepID=UPI002B2699E6|nr:hypothetical protein [Marinovum sp.]